MAVLRLPTSWHKYHAKRTVLDGVTFPSRHEAERYAELKLLMRAHAIDRLELQPVFPLHTVNLATGEVVRVGAYIADFRYWDVRRQCYTIEDAKGVRMPIYVLKKKMCEAEYGITIVEV